MYSHNKLPGLRRNFASALALRARFFCRDRDRPRALDRKRQGIPAHTAAATVLISSVVRRPRSQPFIKTADSLKGCFLERHVGALARGPRQRMPLAESSTFVQIPGWLSCNRGGQIARYARPESLPQDDPRRPEGLNPHRFRKRATIIVREGDDVRLGGKPTLVSGRGQPGFRLKRRCHMDLLKLLSVDGSKYSPVPSVDPLSTITSSHHAP